MGGLLWICLPLLLAAWPARTAAFGAKECSALRCDLSHECRMRHVCNDATSLPNGYLPPCEDQPECVPSVTCVGHLCQRGHHCRLEDDPAPAAAEYRPPLQKAVCRKTLSCDELRCPAGNRCVKGEVCEHSIRGYLPPCETIFECKPQTGKGAKVTLSDVGVAESGARTATSSVKDAKTRVEVTMSGPEKTKSVAAGAKTGAGKTKSGGDVTRSDVDVTKSDVDRIRNGIVAAKSSKETSKSSQDVHGVIDLSTTDKAAEGSTGPAEKDQLLELLLEVVQATSSPSIRPDAQTIQSFGPADEAGSPKTPLGELEKVLLNDEEVGSALSTFSGSADQPASPVLSTVKDQTPVSFKTPQSDSSPEPVPITASNADPQPVAKIDPRTILTPHTPASPSGELAPVLEKVPPFKTAPDEPASTPLLDQVSESNPPREQAPAPELKVAPESFSDIIVLTPESLRTPESASTLESFQSSEKSPFSGSDFSESLVARRSIGLRTCANTRCLAGRRCVLQNNRPTCRRRTCKDVSCRVGARCLIAGGVPVCRTPPSLRLATKSRSGTATSCDALQCAESQKCVLAGGKAWCARRRTCANLRCRYDQHCQEGRGLPRCAIRRSCDGVSCPDSKVCQLIGRLPRCVVAPQCEELNCSPNERCINVRGVPTCLTAPPCYDRRCPPRQECRVVGEEHICVDTPTCEELRCGQGRICRKYFGAAKCITATTCANTHCRHDQKCVVKNNIARCMSLRGALCRDDGSCATGLECRSVNGKPTCVKPATCDGVSCLSGQRCEVLSGTPTCVASCVEANCAPHLLCRVTGNQAVCVECELDCPAGQVCKLRDPRRVTSEYVVSKKKIPHCVKEEQI